MGSSALLCCLLAAAPLDGGVADADADGGVDLQVTPVVAPAYSPELGFLVAAGGVMAWNGSNHVPRSSLALVAGASTVGAFLAQARLTSFWWEDRLRLSALRRRAGINPITTSGWASTTG